MFQNFKIGTLINKKSLLQQHWFKMDINWTYLQRYKN
jgi:hypothetical protein